MDIGYMQVCGLTPHETGRQLLEKMYTARFGHPMPAILKGTRGKPYFADGSIHFSVTHTPHHAFCVFADTSVGIDAEETGRNISLSLAHKILSPAEKHRYEASDDRRAALLRLWVLKEAAGKCAGTGINSNPTHTDFAPDDPRIQILHGCYVAIITEESRCYSTPTPI